MFKVSLFIIYTATVLDFVEVEHYIHNQAHNGYSLGLQTPHEGIKQIPKCLMFGPDVADKYSLAVTKN